MSERMIAGLLMFVMMVLAAVSEAFCQVPPIMTNVTVAWDASVDAASGRVLAYRVYVNGTRVSETGQLTTSIPVRRGYAETIEVSSYGNYDADNDGLIEPGEVGEGVKSAPIMHTAPSVHLAGFLGCYVDIADPLKRALPTQLASSGTSTAACIAQAKAAGFRFAGVQWSIECFAGNERRYALAPVTECNMPCSNAPGELCGGGSRNSIYPTGLPPLAPSGVKIIP